MTSFDETSEVANLIDEVYASIRFPETWPNIIRRLGDWLDADIGMMISPPAGDANAIPLVVYGLDVTKIADKLPANIARAEISTLALATGRAPGAFLLRDLIPQSAQSKSLYWQEVLAPLGVASGVIAMIRTDDDGGKPVVIHYYRFKSKPAYTEADLKHIQMLTPHLRRALGLVLDPTPGPGAVQALTAIYEVNGAACFFLGQDGEIIHSNSAAEILIAARDGVDVRDGKLVLWDKPAQADLDRVMPRLIGKNWSLHFRTGAEFLASRPSRRQPFVMIATPLTADNTLLMWAAPVRCVLYVLEGELRANWTLSHRLQRLYALTGAEAAVAIAIASGSTLREIATSRNSKIDTVRTQAKSALTKTGARKQAELATLVNRLSF